jgi:hypothetical protein
VWEGNVVHEDLANVRTLHDLHLYPGPGTGIIRKIMKIALHASDYDEVTTWAG